MAVAEEDGTAMCSGSKCGKESQSLSSKEEMPPPTRQRQCRESHGGRGSCGASGGEGLVGGEGQEHL